MQVPPSTSVLLCWEACVRTVTDYMQIKQQFSIAKQKMSAWKSEMRERKAAGGSQDVR